MFQVSLTDYQVMLMNSNQPPGKDTWYFTRGQIPALVKALNEAAVALDNRGKPIWDIPDTQ